MPSEERASQLETYYDLCQAATSANYNVLEVALSQAQGSRSFTPGRVVILFDQHFSEHTPAVIVRQASPTDFLVLAAVTEKRKSGSLGK